MGMKRSGIVLAALAASLAACGGAGGPTAAPSPPGSPAGPTESVLAYYGVEVDERSWITPERRQVPEGGDLPRQALDEVVEGAPQDPDHDSPFPEAAEVAGLEVASGTATVDWNARMLENPGATQTAETLAIQSAVYTLLQFDGIERVRFTVEGKAAGKASNGRDIEDFWGHGGLSEQPLRQEEDFIVAPIVVWEPLDGARVGDSVRIEGTASVFEGTVGIRLADERGEIVASTTTTASEGGPGRGDFEATVPIASPPAEPQRWRLEVFESSPEEEAPDVFIESRTVVVSS